MQSQSSVLLLHYDPAFQRTLGRFLTERGFAVDLLSSGFAGLRRLAARAAHGAPYGMLLAAPHLMDIDGPTVLRVARSRYPDLPVVLLEDPESPFAAALREKLPEAHLMSPDGAPDKLIALLRDVAAPQPCALRLDTDSVSLCYGFLRLDEAADGARIFSALDGMPEVGHCDAVRGRWDIIAEITPGDSGVEAMERELLGLAGVASAGVRVFGQPPLPEYMDGYVESWRALRGSADSLRDPSRVKCYVLLETEAHKMAGLFVRLFFLDEVLEVGSGDCGSLMLALLQGESRRSLSRLISENLRYLDGVLRIEEAMVVSMGGQGCVG